MYFTTGISPDPILDPHLSPHQPVTWSEYSFPDWRRTLFPFTPHAFSLYYLFCLLEKQQLTDLPWRCGSDFKYVLCCNQPKMQTGKTEDLWGIWERHVSTRGSTDYFLWISFIHKTLGLVLQQVNRITPPKKLTLTAFCVLCSGSNRRIWCRKDQSAFSLHQKRVQPRQSHNHWGGV